MKLTIVTYHYLRDPLAAIRPGFDALGTAAFETQLDFFAQHYAVVAPAAVGEALSGGRPLPDRALMLSFDDGLIEHFTIAHPALQRRGWSAAFFPPVASTCGRRLLMVHKIHAILAHCSDRRGLAIELRHAIDQRVPADGLRPAADYYAELAHRGRYDDADTMFVKRALQRGLPVAHAGEIADALLQRHLGLSPGQLAERHYLTYEQLRQMAAAGQEIGGHGDTHIWLDAATPQQRAEEIRRTADFLGSLGAQPRPWCFSYPYGRPDPLSIPALKAAGCIWAVSTEPRIADLAQDDRFALPRFDTNDFPGRDPATVQHRV